MKQFRVDEELCIKCGLCAKDCPLVVIAMDDFPVMGEGKCWECQHCLAVCPTGALSILGRNPLESTPLKDSLPAPEQVKVLMKGRRSVRLYKDENLPPEVIHELLDTAWHAPTGLNDQTVQFSVVADKETMDWVRDEIYQRLGEMLSGLNVEGDPGQAYRKWAIEDHKKNGTDFFFHSAPHLVVASSPENGPSPEADSIIALAYVELMAQSMGIGTVWNGMVKYALQVLPDLAERIGVPAGHHIGYVMSFGKPAITYQRTVERGPAKINMFRRR